MTTKLNTGRIDVTAALILPSLVAEERSERRNTPNYHQHPWSPYDVAWQHAVALERARSRFVVDEE